MDLLAQYSCSDGEEGSSEATEAITISPPTLKVSSAPEVSTKGLILYDNKAMASGAVRHLQDAGARKVMYNLPVEDLYAPVLGPAHPYSKDGLASGVRNHYTGHVEDTHMNAHHFDEQYHSFHVAGYGQAPGGGGIIAQSAADMDAAAGRPGSPTRKRKSTTERRAEKEDRGARLARLEGDPAALFEVQRRPWAEPSFEATELTEEQKAYIARMAAEKEAKVVEGADGGREPTAFFHAKDKKDYQGRSWMAAPRDRRAGPPPEGSFLPKQWIHTWSGHAKGVNAIRFIPQTGHLLLSAGLDGKVKIWDVGGSQKCLCTYMGHSKGVRDITFSNDGRRFLSTGYDKQIRLWDTETGQCIRTVGNGKTHFCVRLHPEQQNILMTGCQDRRIYQFDLNTGDVVQEYNYHLGAVNSVTFIEGGSQFVSTSDDKTIRVWEFGIPVQIKYIADPSMHSVPCVSSNAENSVLLMQSLDNQVLSYSSRDGRFRQLKKKTFKGHNTAGYACQVNFSPDGKYVMSGDSQGRCLFWEWQRPQRPARVIAAHEGAVCIGCEWNPAETSRVATCGWDGLIKYWD